MIIESCNRKLIFREVSAENARALANALELAIAHHDEMAISCDEAATTIAGARPQTKVRREHVTELRAAQANHRALAAEARTIKTMIEHCARLGGIT